MNDGKGLAEFYRPEEAYGGSPRGTRMGIVGGHGEMGSLFSRFFGERGFSIEVADLDTPISNREVVEASEVVIFAVPLHRTVEIIRDLIPHTRPGQLIMDLTSLKVAPVREMLRSPASVVGLHPMFGGRISSFEGQTLVACPVRVDNERWDRFRKLFTQAGIHVKESTPEEHDRMMSIIQVLFHMTSMLTGRVLRDLGVDIAETMDYTSPSYRLEINLLGRMFAQSSALYSAITQMNPYTKDIISQLQRGLEKYEEWYDAEDLGAFMEDFSRSSRHLGEYCRRAYSESSALMDFAVKLAHENDKAIGRRDDDVGKK